MKKHNMKKHSLTKTLIKVTICASLLLTGMTAGLGAEGQAYAATTGSKQLIATSKEYIGTPYKYGAAPGSTSAFDCSSFTQFIFRSIDIKLPRTSTAQPKVGKQVSKNSLSTGDLVFFNTNGKSISHVGIYAGNNKFIHSSSSQGVTVTSMSSNYWKNKYVTARRVL